jgi:hypothetical protein
VAPIRSAQRWGRTAFRDFPRCTFAANNMPTPRWRHLNEKGH